MSVPVANGGRLTGAARMKLAEQLKASYDEGASVRQLAADCERSFGWVHRLLLEAGTTMRSRGGRPRPRP